MDIFCPICLEDCSNFYTLNCNHNICNNCTRELIIRKKFKNCPLCRTKLTIVPVFSNNTLISTNTIISTDTIEQDIETGHIEPDQQSDESDQDADVYEDNEVYEEVIYERNIQHVRQPQVVQHQIIYQEREVESFCNDDDFKECTLNVFIGSLLCFVLLYILGIIR